MGKCWVFIPTHSHQAIPVPIPIPMKLAQRFPFPRESHGTHGTHGNSQYSLISTPCLADTTRDTRTRVLHEVYRAIVIATLCHRCMTTDNTWVVLFSVGYCTSDCRHDRLFSYQY